MSAAEIERQRQLVQAVFGGTAEGPWRAPAGVQGGAARGLLAYRLNAAALAERALATVFAQLREAMGASEFAAMAWAFWRWRPPRLGDMGEWGADLHEFLAGQPEMEPAWLDLSRLEWALHAAERAADASLDADSLLRLGEPSPGLLRLRMRPGLRLLPADSQGQVLLVWRQGWRARAEPLPAAQALLMAQLLAGVDLQSALDACLAAHPDFDFTAWLHEALLQQQLWRVEPIGEPT
ncbi:putative DNA-binding domain-containing protein [Paucibacter sediminis]|uniref:DNA-binding domain-containing protein n=1 Tax=Paucibacter sediminis TaxID=3019553 RepID=A0AA95SN92_9BURK|nr:putative DNA-binding domain-containing protein [Paucibacter sp. S2-9]WIT11000.1 putative DNA-binding domain-containing protein [Paucibacter sp. S2-9]